MGSINDEDLPSPYQPKGDAKSVANMSLAMSIMKGREAETRAEANQGRSTCVVKENRRGTGANGGGGTLVDFIKPKAPGYGGTKSLENYYDATSPKGNENVFFQPKVRERRRAKDEGGARSERRSAANSPSTRFACR